MDPLVAHDEFVIQSAVASTQKKKVYCVNCGSGFANEANLRRHEETKHVDQTTPEAVAKCLQLKEYREKNGRERRKNDHVYREKLQQTNRLYKMKVKAREAAEGVGHADVKSSISVDITENTPLHEESNDVIGASSTVKKKRTTTAVDRVTTTVLTNENIAEFFKPKWSTPRTKEQRLAAPRSTVL